MALTDSFGGDELIAADENRIGAPPAMGNLAPQKVIVFRGADDGEEQLADAFHPKGTFEGWSSASRRLGSYPRAKLAIIAALCPPLLSILGAGNFIVSYSSPTSQGKTTCLRAAASVWGCPDETTPAAVLKTWDATRVWIERASAVQTHLPFIIDDTKRAQERERHRSDALRRHQRPRAGAGNGYRSVAITHLADGHAGQRRSANYKLQPGRRHTRRVLEIWGSPFSRNRPANRGHCDCSQSRD